MKKIVAATLFCLCIGFFAQAQNVQLIPQPVALKTSPGHFILNKQTSIVVPAGNAECRKLGELLAGELEAPVGRKFLVGVAQKPNTISLKLNKIIDPEIGQEGYHLKVSAAGVTISANQTKGLFYGIQTLMQLLPPDVAGKQKATVRWSIPYVTITDYPRFGWRGLMLDVSRHFFSKQVVLNYIDEMAKYKFNVFHFHLSDDNGWRIEIKGLPQLTDVGAWRVMRTGPPGIGVVPDPKPGEKATYGGYYTQDDIREIVKYAQDRYITVLPEIDVPAHSLALIASFPNLSCTQMPYPVNPGTQFYTKQDNVLCVGNDSTYMILDKVFTQLAQLFPCPYIHVGGDEAYKGFWAKCPKCQAVMAREHLNNVEELQSYFIKRMEQIVTSKGKKLIGWDEILEGGLAPSATVMSWRGMQGGINAAKMGHQVVMTPYENCYLDLYQGSPLVEPHTYGRMLLSDAYEFEPVPDSVDAKYILGGQGNLWTESISDERQIQYMLWPRAMALSEILWSPKKERDFNEFVQRVETHFKRLDAANIKYARSIYDPMVTATRMPNDTSLRFRIATQAGHTDIYYSLDTSIPDEYSLKYNGTPVIIPIGAQEIRTISYRNGKPIGREISVMVKDLSKR